MKQSMTDVKHTPGPWKYNREHMCSSDRWYVITDADGWGPIMDVGGKDVNGQIAEGKHLITDPEIIEANARLIAAAPDMLEALEQAEKIIIEMAQVIYKKEVQDHLSWGLLDKVRAWVRESPAHNAIRRAYTGK